jgi:hypothetical protein
MSVGAAPPTSFGSYAPADVTWLVTDLSGVELELPTHDRERLIQGGRNYAEMLPVEYQPDPAYTALFHEALEATADRLARAVGLVSGLILDDAPPDGPVLVSLARAGTPVGILVRRWLQAHYGMDVPHYTASIVRGVGIDEVALDYVLARHRPEQVRFVDGWTGKGAIARELSAALQRFAQSHPDAGPFDDRLAVLADPGHCTTTFGTRDDFLIPSACLNSTVSGLVSRTVVRDDLIGPGMFHGAKFYAELAPDDLSAVFLDRVTAAFPRVAGGIDALLAAHRAGDRGADWSGWGAVREIADEFGLTDLNLVKPGVGETTRVLLRRRPWQILVRPDRAADLRHVRLLAGARDVPVVERDGLSYSCIGLIKPVTDP